jgi:hypothetical protein
MPDSSYTVSSCELMAHFTRSYIMAQWICNGAQLQCSWGTMPSFLVVTREKRVNVASQPAANIQDFTPLKNIQPFGMCRTQSNPQVAAATAAAFGVLTPQPCIPVTNAPWVPGSATVLVSDQPALNNTSKLKCLWGGVISVTNPGQSSVNIP